VTPAAAEPGDPRGGPDSELPLAVVDIDGVVADVRHRLHHLARRPKDWGSFFAAAGDDPPLPEGLAVVDELARAHRLVYLSGRPEWLRATTHDWLQRHRLPPGELRLRPTGDRRPARILKVAVLRRLARSARVAVLVDDDVAVCQAAREAGFAVLEADWAQDSRSAPTLFQAQETEGRT
jgi:hypothetical protein